MHVDELIIGHTNGPEFERLKGNRFMEALKDRTIKTDVPYLLRWSDEIKVLQQDYGPDKIKAHIMPHTLEIAALFAILTRLVNDPDIKLDLRDKAKLYDGKSLPNWTEDSVKELRDKHPDEGLACGVSARYVQDKISNCLSRQKTYVNAFHVLNELKSGLYNSSLIDSEKIDDYIRAWDLAVKELQEILKNEVQKALISDEHLIERVCAKYIDNVVAYVNDEKVRNPITGQDQHPDERLMRSIEEKIKIPEQGSKDFRRSIAAFIGTLAARKQEFRWDSNPELRRALEAKLFDDTRATIKLSSLSSEAAAVDPELQEKIDAIKTRLIKNFGYNEQSATDVLEYVGTIFASGDE
jgi:serine protein kinase